jgi:hypothetical protein
MNDEYTEDQFLRDLEVVSSTSFSDEDNTHINFVYEMLATSSYNSIREKLFKLADKALAEDISKSQLKSIIALFKMHTEVQDEAIIEGLRGVLSTVEYKA